MSSTAALHEEIIPIIHTMDAARAVAWYARLGFVQEWEHRFEPGYPAFVSIARGSVRIFLSEHLGDARPDALLYLRVNDIDAVAQEFGAKVQDEEWGREFELRDPDANRIRVGNTQH